MVVTKCLFAPGVGQKVSAETTRPKLPSSTLRGGCHQILQVEVSGACEIAGTFTKALFSLGVGVLVSGLVSLQELFAGTKFREDLLSKLPPHGNAPCPLCFRVNPGIQVSG